MTSVRPEQMSRLRAIRVRVGCVAVLLAIGSEVGETCRLLPDLRGWCGQRQSGSYGSSGL